MNRYFSESMLEHPEMNRLRQRIFELERKNEACCEQIGEMTQQISDLKAEVRTEYHRANQAESNLRVAESNLRVAEEQIEEYENEMEGFNNLSVFSKMFYYFDINE